MVWYRQIPAFDLTLSSQTTTYCGLALPGIYNFHYVNILIVNRDVPYVVDNARMLPGQSPRPHPCQVPSQEWDSYFYPAPTTPLPRKAGTWSSRYFNNHSPDAVEFRSLFPAVSNGYLEINMGVPFSFPQNFLKKLGTLFWNW